MFSAIPEKVQYGASHYQWRRPDHSKAINKLFEHYRVEGIAMPYTWEDFEKDIKEEVLAKLTPEERLEGLPLEELLKRVPPEERLKGLSLEELLKHVPPEEFLKRLTKEEIEAYLKKLSTSN